MQYIVGTFAVMLGLLPRVAWASGPGGQLIGRSLECVVAGGVGDFDVSVHPDVITALYFPSTLAGGKRPTSWSRDFKVIEERNALYIRPRGGRRDVTANLVVNTEDPEFRVSLLLKRVDSPGEAMRQCKFVAHDVKRAEEARVDAAVEAREAELRIKLNRDEQERRRALQIATARQRLIMESEWVPMIREMSGDSRYMDIEIGRGTWIDGEFWTVFSIRNPTWRPLRLAHAQILDRSGAVIPIDDVAMDAPAVSYGGALAEIPPGERATGVMRLPDVADKTEPQAITFRGLTGPRMVVATAEEPVWIFVPKRKEEIEAERREQAARGWWSLHGLATAGLVWLPAGVTLAGGDELEDTRTTRMLGFGVRSTVSLLSFLLAEGEVVYASTGEARFANVALEGGTQGDLVRSARLGRLQFGLLLRLRDSGRLIPILRGGAGLQGAFYNAQIEGMMAPGDEFEFTAVWYFGPGLVMPVGNRCALGLGASYMDGLGSLGSPLPSLGISLDFGCAWKPDEGED